MKPSEHPNCRRWLRPPTIEQIEAVIKASGVTVPHFEKYHGIYDGCIRHIRLGDKKMPVQHWHLFLEDTKTNVPNNVPKMVSVTQKLQKRKELRLTRTANLLI